MLQAADTVGVFQVESRAQMQTLPKSRPENLDDLVVEVAIIRPGPIQGNAVHPYLRRKQGLEPVTYLHPSLEPVLSDTMGVILYQEQVMRIAIEVAGFSPAESDGFRRAMGTWRSSREMEKLHRQFVDGCLRQPGMTEEIAEELFRQVAAFASFGFAKSHAAAFARTAYESSFLKLFYPAQFLVGLINAQPMGFYPVEVLVNDAKRHGVAVLPVDINASTLQDHDRVGGAAGLGDAAMPTSHSPRRGHRAGDRSRSGRRPASCPGARRGSGGRPRARPAGASGSGCTSSRASARSTRSCSTRELARGPYRSLADVVERTGLPEEVLERLIRAGGARLARPAAARAPVAAPRGRRRDPRADDGRTIAAAAPASAARRGRPMDLRLPATEAPALPPITESERLGDAYAVVGLDARRQVVGLFREALDRLGAVTNSRARRAAAGSGPDRRPGRHPPAPDDRQGHGLPGPRGRDRDGQRHALAGYLGAAAGVVRRHALLLVDGDLQREGEWSTSSPRRSGRSPRWPRRPAARIGRPASASSATPGCVGSADADRSPSDADRLADEHDRGPARLPLAEDEEDLLERGVDAESLANPVVLPGKHDLADATHRGIEVRDELLAADHEDHAASARGVGAELAAGGGRGDERPVGGDRGDAAEHEVRRGDELAHLAPWVARSIADSRGRSASYRPDSTSSA